MWASLGNLIQPSTNVYAGLEACEPFFFWSLGSLLAFLNSSYPHGRQQSSRRGSVGCPEGGAWELPGSSQAPLPSLMRELAGLGGVMQLRKSLWISCVGTPWGCKASENAIMEAC